jgi:hypothetical protein
MKLSGEKIEIQIQDLVSREEFLIEFAKHACFNRTLVEGICQLLLTDEIQWSKDSYESPWYTIISFGQSEWERARALLIAKASDAAQKQVEMLKRERDNYKEKYDEFSRKCWQHERTIYDLQRELKRARQEQLNDSGFA